jgi:hypothetical protein
MPNELRQADVGRIGPGGIAPIPGRRARKYSHQRGTIGFRAGFRREEDIETLTGMLVW